MDFELSNRQKQIRLAAREFAEGELVLIGKECESKREFPRDLIKKAGQLGFVGVYIKKEYGGLGSGSLEHTIILEEFWRLNPAYRTPFQPIIFLPRVPLPVWPYIRTSAENPEAPTQHWPER